MSHFSIMWQGTPFYMDCKTNSFNLTITIETKSTLKCLFVWILHPFPPYWLYQDAPATLS